MQIVYCAESARGKKVVRLVRRVSGMLLQLTIFELPAAVVQAAKLSVPITVATDKKGENVSLKNDKENTVSGFAEVRAATERLIKYPPPAFRVVAYDPRSKKKVSFHSIRLYFLPIYIFS